MQDHTGINSSQAVYLQNAGLGAGGEMGELIRNFNWSATSLGTPDQWPQNLLFSLRIILHSSFPMLLFWGDDLIQFYNDAYRASLGDPGKHPKALGQKGEDCWPEVWSIIHPHIHQVQTTGIAVWKEDQLVPIYRNGTLEDVYWTYSHSAVPGPSGGCDGVLVTCVETTEKVLSYNRIEESKDQLSFALEAAELGSWDYCPLTNRFTANNRLLDWLGIEADKEISLSDFLEIVADDDREQVTATVRQALASSSGNTYNHDYTIIHPVTGRRKVLRAKGKATCNINSQAIRLNGTMQDITDEAAANKKVEESERNLRNMILQAPVAMCILRGPQFIIEIANVEMYELWGKGEAQLLGKPLFEGLTEVSQQGFEQLLTGVYTTGERFAATEVPVTLPRGEKLETVFVNVLYEAYKEGDGTISGVLVVALDVTPQVTARQKIEEAEERARLAVSSAELGVYEVFLHRDETHSDERCREIFGLDSPGSRQDFAAVFHPDDHATRKRANDEALITGILNYEARVVNGNGKIKWVRVAGKTVFDSKKQPVKILGVVQDITEEKEFSKALEDKVAERTKELGEAISKLHQSNAELNQFAYVASHDLQEPLRKVQTYTGLMQKALGDVPEKAQFYMGKIEQSAERMKTLITDVLSFSLLTKEGGEYEEVDLNVVVQQVLIDFELLIAQKNAVVSVEPLPVISAIAVQMRQLINNLIANSLKFHEASRQLTMSIKSFPLSAEVVTQYAELDSRLSYYQFQFSDNGIGFDQQYANQIFGMFQRLHGKALYQGTGIGLAMCKKIVQNHHGIIYASSTPDQGATFNLILPVKQAETVSNG